MSTITELYLKQLADEAYRQYERVTGITLPRKPNGDFDASGGAFRNNAVDAFRHAYVIGRLSMLTPDQLAKYLGIDHENETAGNPQNERDMDLWNNMIGIKKGNLSSSADDLANRLKNALDNGELMTSPGLLSDEQRAQVEDLWKGILADILAGGNSVLSDLIESFLHSLHTAEGTTQPTRRDPLTFDLDGDGVELINVNQSNAFFDIDLTPVASLAEANDIINNPNNPDYTKDPSNLDNFGKEISSGNEEGECRLYKDIQPNSPSHLHRNSAAKKFKFEGSLVYNPNAVIYSNLNADGSTSYFVGDGIKEQIGWVKGDDALLALDKNNNQTIDNILELFGKSDKTGTEELREYDLNNAVNLMARSCHSELRNKKVMSFES
jgi:hypothetical protein